MNVYAVNVKKANKRVKKTLSKRKPNILQHVERMLKSIEQWWETKVNSML